MPLYRITLIGCGRQAQPLLFELGLWPQTSRINALDSDVSSLRHTRKNLKSLWRREKRHSVPIRFIAASAANPAKLKSILRETDLLISAAPYRFNYALAQAALNAGCHYVDLGGHQETARRLRMLSGAARKKGLFLLPDLGFAPGTANILAGWGLKHFKSFQEAVIYCGGLPVNKKLPLGYKLVYSTDGLLEMYFGKTHALRGGKIKTLDSLSEQERMDFPSLGRLEACVTRGMTAAPWILGGRIKNYTYKTFRYPGHFDAMRLLGRLTAKTPELLRQIFENNFRWPNEKDLVVLLVKLKGTLEGKKRQVIFQCINYGEPARGFSAMEKMTGTAAAIACEMALENFELTRKAGFLIPEQAIDADAYIERLSRCGIPIRRKILPA